MVQVTLRVRPTAGYHAPHKVETIAIQSHERLEKIQEKYTSSGTGTKTRLYFQGRELPLNSSVASQDFQDDDILECCNSPAISAALSACLKDLEEVKKMSYTRRHPGLLKQLLQVSTDVRNNPEHSIWISSNWSDDKIKARTINFAIMKAIIQRKDRWAVHDLPQCNDCQSLYDALQQHKVWKGGGNSRNGSRAFRSQEHLFKPMKNNGEESTNWILLSKKLDLMKGIQRRGYDSSAEDYIEEFVRIDSDRHRSVSAAINDEDAYLSTQLGSLAATSPAASARQLSPRHQQQRQRNRNETSVMMDLSSPERSTTRQPSSTPRSRQSKIYFPQYASGPFSVLAALHLAMHAKHRNSNGRRLLSLTEDELKRQAQRRCRSNLYDKGRIRGRSAFACMDGLVEKELARKEIIRDNRREEIEKWGLLTKGERLGQYCAEFDRAVQHVLPEWNVRTTLHGWATGKNLTMCLDSREDDLFLRRLKQRCDDENVSYVERDLPAGDYLFLDRSGTQDNILPIVIERKSWSDLADSVLGKGRGAKRLECVKLGSHSNECSGNCQLCKMKRCGCSKIMFIIEGERCLGSDRTHRSAPKCTTEKCCSACKSLEERHGIRQEVLEEVLNRLQVDYGCFIHYTKCFNETSTTLLDIKSLLESAASFDDNVSYDSYASNARRRSTQLNQIVQKPDNLHEIDVKELLSLIKSRKWEQRLIANILGTGIPNHQVPKSNGTVSRPRKRNKTTSEAIRLDDVGVSDDGIEIIDSPTTTLQGEKSLAGNDIINIDIDSDKEDLTGDDFIDLCQSQDPLPPPPSHDDDEDFIDLCQSQQSVVSHMRGGGYHSDEDSSVIDLLNESHDDSLPLSSTDSPRKRARGSSPKQNAQMLLLREWSDYDDTFHKAIEKVWKEIQATLRVTDDYESQETIDIYQESVTKLKHLVSNEAFPVIPRRYVLAFTLWLQLITGMQVRDVKRAVFADQIRQSLENNGRSISTSSEGSARAANSSRGRSTSGATSSVYQEGTFLPITHASPSMTSTPVERRPTAATATATKDPPSFVPVASSMKRPAATSLESDLIREARLKRFSQSPRTQSNNVQHQGKRYKSSPFINTTAASTNEWECTKCTMKNTKEICEACETTWRCSVCTYINKTSDSECICGATNPEGKSAGVNLSSIYDEALPTSCYVPGIKPSPSHSRSSFIATKPPSESGTKKPKVCGACGQAGHNRGNATQYNCTAYFDPKEVERREKLEQKRLEKLEAERKKIERLEREGGDAAQNYEEWLRQTEKIKASHEQADEYRKSELKRARQKKARMEKQQQRRNNGH